MFFNPNCFPRRYVSFVNLSRTKKPHGPEPMEINSSTHSFDHLHFLNIFNKKVLHIFFASAFKKSR